MTDTSIEPTSTTERATAQAGEVASTATEQVATVARSATEEAKTVGSQAAQEVSDLVSSAQDQLRSQAAEQAERVASALAGLGGQLRSMAENGQPGLVRDTVDQVASQAEGFASRLGDGGLDGVLTDARRFARNRPGTFLLGAAAAGVLVARVMKAVDTKAVVQGGGPAPSPALGAAPGGGLPNGIGSATTQADLTQAMPVVSAPEPWVPEPGPGSSPAGPQ